MQYELLFLDVDGTLKQEPHGISKSNKDAVRALCRTGKKVTIASGRNKDLILQSVNELGFHEFGSSYSVALNGAHIIDNTSGKTLHTVPIPLHLTKLLFEKAYELEITCHVYTENYVFFNYHDFQYDWYQKGGCNCKLVDMTRKDLGLTEEPLKFFLLSKDGDALKKYYEDMKEVTKNDLNGEFSSIYTLEYTSVNASKGLGMEYICHQLGYELSQAVAVGDGENDISMLKMAGLGIAMKNALDSVKAAADTVTEHTCKEDGVTEIIQKYLLV